MSRPSPAPKSIRRILVAVDRERDLVLVDHAVALAEEHHARLEIVAGIQRPWCTAYAAADMVRLEQDLQALSGQLLRDATARVGSIPVCLRPVCGSAAAHLARRCDGMPGDVVLLARRPRWAPPRRRATPVMVVAAADDAALPAV